LCHVPTLTPLSKTAANRPRSRSLLPSDILNIDITLFTRSHYHGDTSLTFALPSADIFSRALIAVAREALHVGIRACGPGRPFKNVGDAIDEFVREEGFSVNRQFTGHGVGKRFHSQPWVLHHRASLRSGFPLLLADPHPRLNLTHPHGSKTFHPTET
jgi:methionine aminopeptidase